MTDAPLRAVVGVTRTSQSRANPPAWIGDVGSGTLDELLSCGHPGAARPDPWRRARIADLNRSWPPERACYRCLTAC